MGVATYLFFRAYRLQNGLSAYILLCFYLIFFLSFFSFFYLSVPLFCCLIYLYAEKKRQGQVSWLDAQSLQYLGRVSYSLYMVHYVFWVLVLYVVVVYCDLAAAKPIYKYIGDHFSMGARYGLAALYMLASVIVSMVSYHACEVPARQFINNYARRGGSK